MLVNYVVRQENSCSHRTTNTFQDIGSPPLENIPDVGGRIRCESSSSEAECEDSNVITVDDLETPAMQHNGISQPVKHFYFYQGIFNF